MYAAYAGGKRIEAPTAHVRRLEEAQLGLPFLTPAWQRDVESTTTRADLERMRVAFERAPIQAAKRAAKAKFLLFAMDEPGVGPGPTELDGERAHPVRVGLVDLSSSKVLLRLRRMVDPSWISAAERAEYSRGLDSCKLALDVHDSVKEPRL